NAQRKTIEHRILPRNRALAFLRSLNTVVDCLSLGVAQTHRPSRRELNLRRGRSDERRAGEEPFLRRGLSLKAAGEVGTHSPQWEMLRLTLGPHRDSCDTNRRRPRRLPRRRSKADIP